MKSKGIFLKMADASMALKKTVAQFQTARKDFKFKTDEKNRVLYFIPLSKMCSNGKKIYKDKVKTIEQWQAEQQEQQLDPVLKDIADNTDFDR